MRLPQRSAEATPALPLGAVATILSMCLAIGAQLREVGFVVFPTDASMHLLNEKQSLLLEKRLGVERVVRMFAGVSPSETECTSVARIAQHVEAQRRAAVASNEAHFYGDRCGHVAGKGVPGCENM